MATTNIKKRKLRLLGGAAVILGAMATLRYDLIARRSQPVLLDQPEAWVAFEADVEISKPDMPLAVGHFRRNSAGSTRLETGPVDGSVRIISIQNIEKATFYGYGPKEGWTARPMVLRPGGHRPALMRQSTVGLTKYGFKAALRKGEDGNLRATSGLEAYHYTTPSGNVWLMIPELNFFPALMMTVEGRRELYRNIEFTPQPDDLFEPPPGSSIKQLTTPGGIVGEKPTDNQLHPYHGQIRK